MLVAVRRVSPTADQTTNLRVRPTLRVQAMALEPKSVPHIPITTYVQVTGAWVTEDEEVRRDELWGTRMIHEVSAAVQRLFWAQIEPAGVVLKMTGFPFVGPCIRHRCSLRWTLCTFGHPSLWSHG